MTAWATGKRRQPSMNVAHGPAGKAEDIIRGQATQECDWQINAVYRLHKGQARRCADTGIDHGHLVGLSTGRKRLLAHGSMTSK